MGEERGPLMVDDYCCQPEAGGCGLVFYVPMADRRTLGPSGGTAACPRCGQRTRAWATGQGNKMLQVAPKVPRGIQMGGGVVYDAAMAARDTRTLP